MIRSEQSWLIHNAVLEAINNQIGEIRKDNPEGVRVVDIVNALSFVLCRISDKLDNPEEHMAMWIGAHMQAFEAYREEKERANND